MQDRLEVTLPDDSLRCEFVGAESEDVAHAGRRHHRDKRDSDASFTSRSEWSCPAHSIQEAVPSRLLTNVPGGEE